MKIRNIVDVVPAKHQFLEYEKFLCYIRLPKKRILLFWQNYTAKYGRAVKDGYKSNAFSPLAWYCFFLIIPLIAAAIYVKETITRCIFLGLIVIIILFPLVMYFLLFKEDPKLLQSEAYRIKDKTLDLIAQKGGNFLINPVNLENTEIGNHPADE